jgi:helix-turn-helix, Psq domain
MLAPTQCTIFTHFQPQLQNPIDSSKTTQMEAAIAHLDRRKSLIYAAAAKIYGIPSSTLARRHKDLTVSRATYHQRLNNVREDTLLGYIDALTDRHIPPTTQIIKNLAEEIVKGPIGKNGTARFIKRYFNRICSPYLRPLNRARTSAESIPIFERFYVLVLYFFIILWSFH